jgi:hypothetical protein
LGNRNEAGERLLEFCEVNALFPANTYCEQPEQTLYTWTSPDVKYKNQIDYILGRRQWRSAIQSVKTRPDADCGSDHELLTATVRTKLKKTQVTKGWKLDTDNIPEDYKTDIKKKLATVKLEGGNSEDTWRALKDTFKEVADKHIPKKEKKNGAAWISQDTLRVVANRRQMRVEGKWVEAKKLNGEIQKGIRKDKEKYLQEKCRVLEEHNKKGRTRELYQQIRKITGKQKTNTGAIVSKTGVEHIEKDKIIRRWKEYAEELYKRDPNVSVSFKEKTYTQEPLVMESEVRKALQGITGRKATGVDELPIELIKAVGETALTALCQQIWTYGPKSGKDLYSYLYQKKVILDCAQTTERSH